MNNLNAFYNTSKTCINSLYKTKLIGSRESIFSSNQDYKHPNWQLMQQRITEIQLLVKLYSNLQIEDMAHHQSKLCLMQLYPASLYDTNNCPELI